MRGYVLNIGENRHYSQVKVNGKVELVPLELYADGKLKRQEINLLAS